MMVNQLSFGQQDKISNLAVYPGCPSRVEGVAINILPFFSEQQVDIHGLELEISPISPLVFAVVWPYALFTDQRNRYESREILFYKQIKGVHIGIVNFDPTQIAGMELNVINADSSCQGLSIATINILQEITGVSIGLLRAYSAKCTGVQIGIINETQSLKGFQFGLWNKNEKRQLPFINWNF